MNIEQTPILGGESSPGPKPERVFWDAQHERLTRYAHYDWPEPHEETHVWEKCEPAVAHYYCAVNGEAFALKSLTPGLTCIANTESAFRLLGVHPANIYIVFALANKTQSAWNRWAKKWTVRTQ